MSNDISRLKGADKIRKRVGVMLGSDDIRGVQQTLFEIISNSIDRFKAGYGDIIYVTKHKDLSYTVEDKADGLPVEWNEKEQAYNWELTTRVLYAGGNYNTTKDTHDGQLGANGLGLASSVMSCKFAEITSRRDEKEYIFHYKQGRPVHHSSLEFLCEDGEALFSKELGQQVLKVAKYQGETGTTVHYLPDLEVFTDINIPIEWIKDKCKKQTVVNQGLTILITDETTESTYEYCYGQGLRDYIIELSPADTSIGGYIECKGEGLGRDREDKEEYKTSFSTIFTFRNDEGRIECYHNSSELIHGGCTLDAVKNALVGSIHNLIKDLGLYNKKESKVKVSDIEDSLVCIISSYSNITSYSNQTKTSIDNKFIQEFVTNTIKNQVEVYFTENQFEAKSIANQILINKRSREKASQTRLDIQKKLGSETKNSLSRKIEGLKDCDMRHSTLEERIFLIDEGLSANSTVIEAFDNRYMGCMGLKGRFINALKASIEDVLNNEPALGVIKALGCGIEIPKEERKNFKDIETFDITKLRYGNIGILCDFDGAGRGITLALLTFFYRFMPTLLKEGRVQVVISPRYEVRDKKKVSYYGYSEAERDSLITKLDNQFLDVSIRKGLGEFNKEEFWDLVLKPSVRDSTFIKVTYDEAEDIDYWFNTLMGEDIVSRKQYIKEHIVNINLEEID